MSGLLVDLGTYISAAIGVASVLVRAADAIAGITPSTADDEFVGRLKRGLGTAVRWADRLALNPPKPKARAD